jgi:hypothetical protein
MYGRAEASALLTSSEARAMTRRSFLLTFTIFTVLLCGGATVLCMLIRFEPSRYADSAIPPGPIRTEKSKEFYTEFCALITALSNEHDLDAHFTDEQINSYFVEGFVQSGLDHHMLPEEISQPRLVFEPDRVRLAFRYGSGFWSTVISVDMKVWLAKGEANAVLLELESFQAGFVPISAQSILERISEVGRRNGIDVSWFRHEGHPVALLRFQADQPRTPLQLQAVRLEQGAVTIQIRANDGVPARNNPPVADASLHPLGE